MSDNGGSRPALSRQPARERERQEGSPSASPFRRLVRWVGTSPLVEPVASVGDRFVFSIAMLLATVLLGRTCTKSVFAAFGITKFLLILLNGLRHSLVELPVMVFVPAQGRSERPATLGAAAILELALALIFFATMWAAVGCMSVIGAEAHLIGAVSALAAASLFVAGRELMRASLYSLHRPRTVVLVSGSSRAVFALGVFVLYFRGLLSPVTAWLALGAADGFALLIARRYVPFSLARGLERLGETARSFWGFGHWVAGSCGMMWVARFFPILALGMLHGLGTTAGVFAALSIAAPLSLVATPLSNVFLARGSQVLSKSGPAALARYLAVRRVGLLLVVGVLALPLAAFAQPLLHLFYAGRYDHVAWVVRCFVVQLFLMAIVRTLSLGLICLRRTRLHFAVHAVSGTTSLLAVYPLISRFGAPGCMGLIVGIEVLYCILFYGACRFAIRQSCRQWDESKAER